MDSFYAIENKINLEIQSVFSCALNNVDNYLIYQKRDSSVLQENLKTGQLCLIDLTVDECMSPEKNQDSKASPDDVEKDQFIFKTKNTTTYPSNSVKVLTKTELKQTQLSSFFCSAKNSSHFKNESCMKPNNFDLCECLNVKLNHTGIKTAPEYLSCVESNKDIDTKSNLQYNVKEEFSKEEVVDLCVDSGSEKEAIQKMYTKTRKNTKSKVSNVRSRGKISLTTEKIVCKELSIKPDKVEIKNDYLSPSKTLYSDDSKHFKNGSISLKKRPFTVESEKNQCPVYKVIEGTTFAVDAFNFGLIKDVTAYFLTHFHTDHYLGLTKKFSMPIYASEITINLIRGFISVDEKLMKILPLNTPLEIEGVKVRAIDANHCPGAIMLLFQMPCGKRILHTGDFRWSHKMELDLHLNRKNIELLYLDTTHISDKHIISSQAKCISKAINWVREFKQRNEGKKILYVVCTDVIGKENFWLSIAEAFDMKIWSDGKRRKALSIIGNENILKKLVSNANEADMHVVSHSDAGFRHLDEYFHKFSKSYDMVLSIKPKGSDSIDPEFAGPVNSIAIRYSEHSTHKELRRFLRFLLPKRVISTVPLGKNIFRCPKIPVSWHTKELYVPYRKQASLLNYVSVKKE